MRQPAAGFELGKLVAQRGSLSPVSLTYWAAMHLQSVPALYPDLGGGQKHLPRPLVLYSCVFIAVSNFFGCITHRDNDALRVLVL